MVPTVAMAIFMGVFPNVFLKPMEASVNRVIERVKPAAPAQTAAPAADRRTLEGRASND
jgi:NADH:ubiquinone oxidoreductase subunit 4 (subunit M)